MVRTLAKKSVKIEGLEEVRDLFDTLRREAPEEYKKELQNAGSMIESSAKSKVNSVTGNLKESFRTKEKFTETIQKVSVIAGGTKAPHAHLVEYGHRQVTSKGEVVGDVPAHPFLRPAFEQHKEALVKRLTEAIERLAR